MSSGTAAMEILEATSRTFFIPISRLPSQLKETVASAYLCFRAIDEVEDHSRLNNDTKVKVLHGLSLLLQSASESTMSDQCSSFFQPWREVLPEVTLRLDEWALLAPRTIAPRIWDATAAMADRTAGWALRNWKIRNEDDLDRYTFSVAGAVGLLLSDLWAWYEGVQTDRHYALGFGRGLQAVNILRNRPEDLERGVDFYPTGWSAERMHDYARRNLSLADAYVGQLQPGPALEFCKIPLTLAYATLEAMERGELKLSRSAVLALTSQTTST